MQYSSKIGRVYEMMQRLGLNEATDQLASREYLHNHALRKEDALGMTLGIKVQRSKGKLKKTWSRQFKEESMKLDFKWEDVPC